MKLRLTAALAVLAVAASVAGCGSGSSNSSASSSAGGSGGSASSGSLRGQTVTIWSNENQPDRIAALKADLTPFTAKTGIKVTVVAVPDNQLPTMITNSAAAGQLPDIVAATDMATTLTYAKQGVFDPEAAQQVVDKLGAQTFSQRALDLVRVKPGGPVAGVPSDGWGQMVIYRKDLFKQAGLPVPNTLARIQQAAKTLNKPGMAGITLATKAGDDFTSQSFEAIALADGCQLVNAAGTVTIDSPQCVNAFNYYGGLARNYSVQGSQDVDSTEATYFAGRAAMILWSPYLLDGMAGLENDAKTTCPQCKSDPAFLAKNSGLVGPLAGAGQKPAQFGLVSTFAITAHAHKAAAEAAVEYLMSDGYTRWLALAPQGKYPVRFGTTTNGHAYQEAWPHLLIGVDRREPLDKAYDKASLESIAGGASDFTRWAFPDGQGALLGALSGEEPIANAVAAVVNGTSATQAAQQAKAAVDRIKSGLK
jgi:multiple sugar transport system substrate-binding protein